VTRGGVRGLVARWRGRDIELKSLHELDAMRAAGALVARTLAEVVTLAKSGVSTAELDALAEQTIRDGAPSRRSRATTATRRRSARR
jgi:methionyl aminopeptidase